MEIQNKLVKAHFHFSKQKCILFFFFGGFSKNKMAHILTPGPPQLNVHSSPRDVTAHSAEPYSASDLARLKNTRKFCLK